jgi:Uncharacterized protein conserved in bacteria (DUF2188)
MAKKPGPVVVTRRGPSWPVKQDGQVISTHRTQRAANDAARREAIKDGVERITQGRDHRFVSKDSFGNESKRRDTEY